MTLGQNEHTFSEFTLTLGFEHLAFRVKYVILETTKTASDRVDSRFKK